MEVCGVVPNVNVVANFTPGNNVVAECFALGAVGFVDGMGKAAVDGAQTNANVVTGLYLGGGCLGVLVCQSIDGKVRVVGFKLLCNLVYKGDPNAGIVAAVLLCDLCAVGAVAGLLIVGLRNRHDIDGGVLFKLLAQVRNNHSKDLGVGQAGVGCVGGVGVGSVCQRCNGVNKEGAVVQAGAAVHCIKSGITTANAVLYAPFRISAGVIPGQATRGRHNGSIIHDNALGNNNVTGGEGFKLGGKVTEACVFFKEAVNGIENTALVASLKGHASVFLKGCFNQKAVLIQGGVNGDRDREPILRNRNVLLAQISHQLGAGKNLGLCFTGRDLNGGQRHGFDFRLGGGNVIGGVGGGYLRSCGLLGGCFCGLVLGVASRQKTREQQCCNEHQNQQFFHCFSPFRPFQGWLGIYKYIPSF